MDSQLAIAQNSAERPRKGDKGGYKTPTPLTSEQECEIASLIATGTGVKQIMVNYHLGLGRVRDIEAKWSKQIEDIRNRQSIERDKRIIHTLNAKRERILVAITDKDINKANLMSKTGALVNLTQIRRLEQGLSTHNIALNVSDMTKDQLERYIRTGEVIDAETVNPVVTTLEQTQNNVSNPENTEIDAK